MKKKWFVTAIIFICFTAALSGCSTVKGLLEKDPIGSTVVEFLTQIKSAFTGSNADTGDEADWVTVDDSDSVTVEDSDSVVLMQDDFSDPDSGWEVLSGEYGDTAYVDGTYQVTALVDGQYCWGAAGVNYDNVRIDVDMDVVSTNSAQNDGYGVDCRIQSNGDGYGFRISSDGYVEIERFLDGEASFLSDWTASEAIFTYGLSNHITAICNGNQLTLMVNDVTVADVIDDTFTEGDIALSAISFEAEPVTVSFDNLVVQEP